MVEPLRAGMSDEGRTRVGGGAREPRPRALYLCHPSGLVENPAQYWFGYTPLMSLSVSLQYEN